MLVQLHFVASMVPLFEEFMVNFQHDEPHIHVLYEQMTSLVKTFLLRFVKGEVVASVTLPGLAKLDVSRHNQVPDGELVIGEQTRQAVKKLKEDQQKASFLGMRLFFTTVSNFLQTRLPLGNKLLRFLSCLNPENRMTNTMSAIKYVAKELKIPETDITNVSDEWRMYLHDVDVKMPDEKTRVDHYWREVFKLKTSSGNTKYPHLTNVVKAALVLPHGNADVERGVSVNNRVVTAERNKLGEDTINGIRATKDMVKFSDPQQQKPENVPLNNKILSAARSAYSVYQRKLEEDKKEEERERKAKEAERVEAARKKQEVESMRAKKQTLLAKETSLSEQETSIRDKLSGVGLLLKDGDVKLKDSINTNDKAGINAAQLMIDTATRQTEKLTNELAEVQEKQRSVEFRKGKLLDRSLEETSGKEPSDTLKSSKTKKKRKEQND